MVETLRYRILLLTLPLLLAACGSQESAEPTEAAVMEFTTTVRSRSSLVSNDNFKQKPFEVYGDMTLASKTVVFDGTPVSFDFDRQEWRYSGEQYWFPNHEHSFVALYPADAPFLSGTVYSDSKLSFTYTYPVDRYNDAVDMLVATHRRRYNDGATSRVAFGFDHILSAISLSMSYKGPSVVASIPIRVNSITFKNIPLKAVFAITPAPLTDATSMTGDYVGDPGAVDGWTVTDRGDFTIEFSKDPANPTLIPFDNQRHQLFPASNPLLLLPDPKVATDIAVSYTTFGSDGSEVADHTATVTLPNGLTTGLNHALSLTIVNDKTQIDISIAKWEEGDTLGITVPR